MKQKRIRILIEGRLQGMNFRLQTQQAAKGLDLVGFVRTLSDGRVEIEAQGHEDNLEKLLEWVQQEPHSSQIRSILFRYDDPVSYSEFNVR
ncbi:MAG TPA: acylphosphatase [Anaerolineae bacterium]|nr:acylphosphatase [Anaerolineae bacterium]HMR63257.1 acylphosphatase [Anaerolineae bacterium]